jgi:hypothetical protein
MVEKPICSEQILLQFGIIAMLLVAILYVGLGFAPDLPPSE